MRFILIYGLGEVIGKIALFALLPLYGRFLPVAEFGAITLLFPMVQVLQGSAGLGLSLGVLKYYHDIPGRRGILYWNVLALWVAVITPLSLIFLAVVRYTSLGEYRVGPYAFSVFATAFLIGILGLAVVQFATQLYQAERRPVAFVLLNAGWRVVLVTAISAYLLSAAHPTAKGIFAVIALVGATAGALSFAVLLRRSVARLDPGLWRALLDLGLPMVVGGVCAYLLVAGGRVVINEHMSAEELGIYGMAFGFAQALSLIQAAAGRVNTPEVFRRLSNGQLTADFPRTIAWLSTLALGTGALVIAWSGHWLLTLTGKEAYREGLRLFPLLLMSYVVLGVYLSHVDILYYHGRTKFITANALATGTLAIVLARVLIPRWGLDGAALAQFGTMIVYALTIAGAAARQQQWRLLWFRWFALWATTLAALYGVMRIHSRLVGLAIVLVAVATLAAEV